MQEKYDVIVVGAGAAGMMCAGQAATRGLRVLMIEKNHTQGMKLRITGKGRCNITNIKEKSEFLHKTGPDSRFLYGSFSTFFTTELLSFFQDIDLKTKIEQGGRVFPASDKATEVVEKLHKWLTSKGVKTIFKSSVKKLIIENKRIIGIELENSRKLKADNVVIATGGLSYPLTGSTGDGYVFAQQAGHQIMKLKPLLVPFITDNNDLQLLSGLKLKNINASIWVDNKKKYEVFGELDFYEKTIEGAVILSLSRQCMDDIMSDSSITLSIDLKPSITETQIDQRLQKELSEMGKLTFTKLLEGLLPKQMIIVLCNRLNISGNKFCHQITSQERKKLIYLLKHFEFKITGHAGFARAVITGGGVSIKEINPKTMESKLVKNLYFIGEVLDIDADTGGYNLQIAFSTAYTAAFSIKTK